MYLTKTTPANTLVRTSPERLMRFFDFDFPFGNRFDFGTQFEAKVDVIENEGGYEISVYAPGMNKKDFNVEIDDGILTVSGERPFDNEKKYAILESGYGSFSRSFKLPKVDPESVNAKYKDGVLNINVTKKNVKSTIEIK